MMNFNFLDPTRPAMGGPLAPQLTGGGGGAPSPATGSAPMNLMPQGGAQQQQPGAPPVQNFLQMLGGLAQPQGQPGAQPGGNPIMDMLQGMFSGGQPGQGYLPKAPSMVADWMLRGKTGGLF